MPSYFYLINIKILNFAVILVLGPKSSANPITVTPIWKREFANGEHPIRGLYRIFFEIFFSNFRSHIKDCKWGRKCIFMNCASCNGSPQQIPLRQLPFANEAKPHSHCRGFWALSRRWVLFDSPSPFKKWNF